MPPRCLAPLRETPPAPARPTRGRAVLSEPDDLEQIIGIGPSTKRVLVGAGFMTFDAIATSAPEQLNDALGDLARFANVDHWIRQAQELAS